LILALNLYLKLPFGKLHHRNEEIIRLAGLIGRTPDSVAMRLSNFANVDPYHQNRGIVGLKGGRKQVEPIWEEFAKNREALIFESESILALLENKPIEEKYSRILDDISGLKGEDRIKETRTRVNQHVFREMVLANYSGKCAISGINIPSLLNSSHIIPWSKNQSERLNPENGICLSALYDRAFDQGLITIKPDYHVLLSSEIKSFSPEFWFQEYFLPFESKQIHLPVKYLPKKEFLDFHYNEVYKG